MMCVVLGVVLNAERSRNTNLIEEKGFPHDSTRSTGPNHCDNSPRRIARVPFIPCSVRYSLCSNSVTSDVVHGEKTVQL